MADPTWSVHIRPPGQRCWAEISPAAIDDRGSEPCTTIGIVHNVEITMVSDFIYRKIKSMK